MEPEGISRARLWRGCALPPTMESAIWWLTGPDGEDVGSGCHGATGDEGERQNR